MLFKQSILKGIAEGRITLAFRRWSRPTVKAGGSLKTSIGVLRIESVDAIDERRITSRAAKQAGFDSVTALIDSLGDRKGKLYRIKFTRAGDDPRIALRESDNLSDDEINELLSRLDRLDAHSKVGPWTIPVLRLIEKFPELRAVELARRSGYEKEWLKLNIRKLKNLGLTESLEVGYRLSPRGRAFLTLR
jgi:hypothetical protein